MISQSKNKIYIIGANQFDIYDLTVKALKSLNKSSVVILSKNFEKKFIYKIRELGKSIFFQESLSPNNNEELWQKIFLISKKENVISHLINGDPLIDSRGFDELNFFKRKRVNTEIVPGVINIVKFLNNKNCLLTDRNTNSSVTLLNSSSPKKIKYILKNIFFEKLIIHIKFQDDIVFIKKLIDKINTSKKISVIYFVDGEFSNLPEINSKNTRKFSKATYILIRKNDEV